jgi:hypothetical protein
MNMSRGTWYAYTKLKNDTSEQKSITYADGIPRSISRGICEPDDAKGRHQKGRAIQGACMKRIATNGPAIYGLTLSLGLGMLIAHTTPSVSQVAQESIDSNRDSIVQGVRDNVRRQIRAHEDSSARMEISPRKEKHRHKRRKQLK